jgi:L-alanine-DL-glutamate epimerase-like enolase superfamily enzyme
MPLEVLDYSVHLRPCRTRLPFRFGAVTMRRAWLATLKLRVGVADGGEAYGYAGDLLVPRWFDKNPAKSVAENAFDLVDSIQRAARFARDLSAGPTLFQMWRALDTELEAAPGAPDLLRGFGIAMVERALLDAQARILDLPFADVLLDPACGFDPGMVHPELRNFDLRSSLQGAGRDELALRHTVGMADPLLRGDGAIDDGLPATLEDEIDRYGIDHFKLKVGAGPREDQARLCAIAEVVAAAGVAHPRFTLDGNEQYARPADFLQLLDGLDGEEFGRMILEGLLYVEQPFARAATLDPRGRADLAPLAERVPLIIDEADGTTDAFARAIDLGYRGVSVKNCKGVFRALLNRGLCEHRGGGLFQAGEDLTNLPIVPLHQNLSLAGTLGLEHLEMNGHHYFRGLDHLAPELIGEALERHPDLYQPFDGGARLRIEGGRLRFRSVLAAGFGSVGDPPLDDLWEVTHLHREGPEELERRLEECRS